MDEIFKYLNELNEKHPAFDPSKWTPPSQRSRKDKDGWEYKNIHYNKGTKTFWYEMKKPNERWSGPYHGRTINWFLKQEES